MPEKRRNQGELGHAEMAQHLRNIASALAQIPAYTVPAEDLSVAAIENLATTYETLNKEMATLGSEVTRQRTARRSLYDGETGLKETMKSIKNAVKAQVQGRRRRNIWRCGRSGSELACGPSYEGLALFPPNFA